VRRPTARGRALAALALITAPACAPPQLSIAAPLPAGVDRVALWFESGSSVVHTTGFVARGALRTKLLLDEVLPAGPLTVRLFAWPEGTPPSTLDAVGAAALEAAPLVPASTADPVVEGLASWSGLFEGDVVELEADPRAPEATARWLPRCPTLVAPSVRAPAFNSCLVGACAPFVQQQGCTLVIDATDCVATGGAAPIDGRGRIALPSAFAGTECRQLEPAAPAIAAFQCESPSTTTACTVEVFAPNDTPPVAAARVPLFEQAPSELDLDLDAEVRLYATGLVPLASALVVPVFADGTPRRVDCSSATPMALLSIDRATSAIRRAPLALACATHPARDPLGDGFVALARGFDGRHVLARVSAAGVVTASVALPAAHAAWSVRGLVARRDRFVVAIRPRAADGKARVLFADPHTLTVTTSIAVDGREAVGMAADERGQLGLVIDEDDRMLLLSAATSRAEGQVVLTPFAVRQLELSGVYHHPASDRWLVTAALRTGGIVVSTDREAFGVARVFELPGTSSVLGPSPADPALVLSATIDVDPDTRFARLRHFDPIRARYLPGTLPLDRGQVTALVPDGDVVWALQGTAGVLWRVSAP
jgi:hypothetical protein